MDVGAEAMTAYRRAPALRTISNTAALQALRHNALGVTQAVFHSQDPLAVDDRFTLSPDRACLLLIREEAGRMILGVSDPRRGTADLRIKGDSAGTKVLRTFSAEGVGL